MNQIRVLIVDDQKGNVESVKENLTKAGFSTLEAFDGQTALDLLKKEKIALMILDLNMPGMSGGEVLKRVRRDPALKEIANLPVIIVSYIQDAGMIRSIESKPNTYYVQTGGQNLIEKIKSVLKIN